MQTCLKPAAPRVHALPKNTPASSIPAAWARPSCVGPFPAGALSSSSSSTLATPLGRFSPSCSRSSGVAAAGSSISNGLGLKPWWERDNPANMKEVNGIQELIDELADAGDKLVIVDFYAQWCNACRAVFPKICKLVGERQDNVVFLKINFDDNRDVAKSMGVKVLPYFQFYRGGEGKVEQFSCTVSKVQRFKDALDVYAVPFCSLEPPPGLEEFPDVHPHPELHPEYEQGVYAPAYEWGQPHEDELHPLANTPTVLGKAPLPAAAAAPVAGEQREVAMA